MYRGSGLPVGSTQRSIPGIRPGLLPLSLTWCNQTSKQIDADLRFIWGPEIWRLSHTGDAEGGSEVQRREKKKVEVKVRVRVHK